MQSSWQYVPVFAMPTFVPLQGISCQPAVVDQGRPDQRLTCSPHWVASQEKCRGSLTGSHFPSLASFGLEAPHQLVVAHFLEAFSFLPF